MGVPPPSSCRCHPELVEGRGRAATGSAALRHCVLAAGAATLHIPHAASSRLLAAVIVLGTMIAQASRLLPLYPVAAGGFLFVVDIEAVVLLAVAQLYGIAGEAVVGAHQYGAGACGVGGQ